MFRKDLILVSLFVLILVKLGFFFFKRDTTIEADVSVINGQLGEDLVWPWRGITVVSHGNREKVNRQTIDKLALEGVNLIRLRISYKKFSELNKISLEESIVNNNAWAKDVIGWCEASGIKVLISHSDFPIDPKMGFNQTSPKFWDDRRQLDLALSTIKSMVNEFDKYEAVVAYEFLAEPVRVSNGKAKRPEIWVGFFNEIIENVRLTSDKYLLFTPGPWGGPNGYKNFGKPFSDPKIIYNFHFYAPHKFTHQGMRKNDKQYTYPGMIGINSWDKSTLEREINIATDWARKFNVRYLFAGEFSAVRWADGRDDYIRDAISIFESEKIGWAYFSMNGWNGWDYNYEPEAPGSRKLTKYNGESETLKILKKNWGINLINE